MPIQFSGWEASCERYKHLNPGQAPKRSHGYCMYHGTHKSHASAIISSGFKRSSGGTLGEGVYCSRDINKAKRYPFDCASNDQVVLELRVRVGKVKRIDNQCLHLMTTWHQHGYDTAWLPSTLFGQEEDCIWDPKRLVVVGVAHCTDPANKRSLENLIGHKGPGAVGRESVASALHLCKVCGKRSQEIHRVESCWTCKGAVCPFMEKHECQGGR